MKVLSMTILDVGANLNLLWSKTTFTDANENNHNDTYILFSSLPSLGFTNLNYRITASYYVLNKPDNKRDRNDTMLIQFNTQILDSGSASNGARPAPNIAAVFGTQSTSANVPLLINAPSVEIELFLSKTFVDAMDLVTVSAKINHRTGSTSAAHDVLVTSVLPPAFHIVNGTMKFITTTTPGINITGPPMPFYLSGNYSYNRNVSFYVPYLGVGTTITYSFDIRVDPYVLSGIEIFQPAAMTYYSANNITDMHEDRR